MASKDDELLVEKVLNGDRQAYAGLYEKYRRQAHAFALKKTRNPDTAEECVQEGFTRAYYLLGKLHDRSKFFGWLLSIIANVASVDRRSTVHEKTSIDYINKDGTGVEFHDHVTPDPSNSLGEQEIRDKIMEAIDQLPEEQRQPILLHYLEGLRYREIGALLDMPEGSVRGYVHRAFCALREKFPNLVHKGMKDELPED
jgi:RNA polymerase sigma-70 factor (ECF subfamily)